MRILEILPEEENRVDLLLMRTMGTYSGRTLSLFYYFNPRINILSDITSGTKVWIPEEADIRMVSDYRGRYSLNGWNSD